MRKVSHAPCQETGSCIRRDVDAKPACEPRPIGATVGSIA